MTIDREVRIVVFENKDKDNNWVIESVYPLSKVSITKVKPQQ